MKMRKVPAAMIVDSDYYKILEEALEEKKDLNVIEERKDEPGVDFDQYFKKRFKKIKLKRNQFTFYP